LNGCDGFVRSDKNASSEVEDNVKNSSIRRAGGGCADTRLKSLIITLALSAAAMAQTGAKTGLPAARPEEVGLSPERLRRISDTIQYHIDAKHISGAVTLVARKGRVAHFEAHGLMDIESKKPMRKDTIFVLASMTKPVTGVAVMTLVEEGKIQLTDPVSKFIPEFKGMKVATQNESGAEIQLVPAEREITVRDLLTHTSGLASDGIGTQKTPREALFPTRPQDTLANHIPRLAAGALDFQPGSRWSYSGVGGIDVLARIVEVASAQPFDEFLRLRIFEPLGMKDTLFVLPEDRNERLATVYEITDKGLAKSGFKMIPLPKNYFSGAIGLVSTAEDYFRFAQMLLDGGRWNGKRLLSPRSVEIYSSNHVGEMFGGQLGRPKGMGFGLSVEVVQDSVRAGTFRSNGSFGWDGRYGTHFWVDPKEQLVAILMIQTSRGWLVQRPFETAVMQAVVK
jgi:CubicO group peptidase (beta-lactamase class C family)